MLQTGPTSRDVLSSSAAQAAQLLERGEVSARELTQLVLERIDTLNPKLNAVVELRAEEALAEAAAADRELARGATRPLLGVPITIKEAFNVAGMKTTWGNPAFAGFRADRDAAVVRRLRRAGAILVGKTNVHFMLADFAQTANELYGTTVNPWDPALTPGGSSGGSAAAVAAGLSFLEFGSDLVGSIRIPAAFCGVYGLRPSVNTVPLSGFQPPYVPDGRSEGRYMSAVGPIARSAADLRIALSATAGPEMPEAHAYTWRPASPRHTSLRDYRVGFVLDHEFSPVSGEVGRALSDLVDRIAAGGARIVEGWPDGIDPVRHFETFGYHVELFLASQQPGASLSRLPELLDRERERMASRAAWSRYFEGVDVFLSPANFTVAFPHDSRPFEQRTVPTPEGERPYDAQPFWTAHATLPGLPAVAAPIGLTENGLPLGAQIIGPLHEDGTAIAFAELVAEQAGGYVPPPL